MPICEEVSDILFAQMVSEMNDYSFVLSEATPSDATDLKQKSRFHLQKTKQLNLSTKCFCKRYILL
jgi:hypothetical protein